MSKQADPTDLIQLSNVTVAYRSRSVHMEVHRALQNVTMQIKAGEFVAVVGPNGSGKSTLAQVIAGILPVSKGEFFVSHGAQNEKRHRVPTVQIIFQNPDAQIVGQTPLEDVSFGLENYCCPPADIYPRALHALATVGLAEFANQSVTVLSGGQKALLCIASALAVDAQVLVFDEATAMLDPRSRQHILNIAEQLHARGRTIIWVTQWMEELAAANRVIGLVSGSIQYDGTPRKFFYGSHLSGSGHGSHVGSVACSRPEPDLEPPCLALGLDFPYAVQVTWELLKLGVQVSTLPVSTTELAEGVLDLWT